jgi:hypothetical protein
MLRTLLTSTGHAKVAAAAVRTVLPAFRGRSENLVSPVGCCGSSARIHTAPRAAEFSKENIDVGTQSSFFLLHGLPLEMQQNNGHACLSPQEGPNLFLRTFQVSVASRDECLNSHRDGPLEIDHCPRGMNYAGSLWLCVGRHELHDVFLHMSLPAQIFRGS